MRKILFFDTEYYNTTEKNFKVVCAVTLDRLDTTHKLWWVHEDPSHFIEYIKGKIEEGYMFCAHNMVADVGALVSLGVDVSKMLCLDTMAETLQVQNQNHKRKYGKYIFNGKTGESKFGFTLDKWDKTHVGTSYAAICYNLLGVTPNPNKKDMRNRIIKGGPFDEKDREDILEYCASDIAYLPDLLRKLIAEILILGNINGVPYPIDKYYKDALIRGQWMKNCAIIERRGIPLNIERLKRIQGNKDTIVESLKRNLSENVYPFYVWKKGWVKNDENLFKFIELKGLADKWPKTPASKPEKVRYKADEDTLEAFSHIHEIRELQRVKSKCTAMMHLSSGEGFKEVKGSSNAQTKVVKKNEDGSMAQKIGSDGRLRVFVWPYSSATSRNQPSGGQFIFVMPSWMRCLIQPPPGRVIIGADFRAQESIIAACESGDKNLEAAYDSGDSYIYFAKMAGAVPPEATKKTHPEERDIYKQVSLATQYGMGAKSMSNKLTLEMKKEVSVHTTTKLIGQHRQIFSIYWTWQAGIVADYKLGKPIRLKDGWHIWTDNPNPLSIGNAPMQGNGQAVLRESVERCHNDGVEIIATLHDAIYAECAVADCEEIKAKLQKHMEDAFVHFYGRKIGVDIHVHKRGEEWVEEKARKDFDSLKQYFMTFDELNPDVEFLLPDTKSAIDDLV
jgi:DNA polymerase I